MLKFVFILNIWCNAHSVIEMQNEVLISVWKYVDIKCILMKL